MKQKTEAYTERRDQARRMVSSLSEAIQQVFARIGAGNSDMGELLGSQVPSPSCLCLWHFTVTHSCTLTVNVHCCRNSPSSILLVASWFDSSFVTLAAPVT